MRHGWFLSRKHSGRGQATSRRAATNSFPIHRRLRIERLEDRRMLDADLSGFAAGVRDSLTSFQNEISADVPAANLPLFLSRLANSPRTLTLLFIALIDSAVSPH